MFVQSMFAIGVVILVSRLLESRSHGRDHSPEPIEVEHAQRRVADDIGDREPRRDWQASARLECCPDVLIHPDALIRAPDQTAGAERRDERDSVDELRGRPGHTQLIHEPMDVEKRRR